MTNYTYHRAAARLYDTFFRLFEHHLSEAVSIKIGEKVRYHSNRSYEKSFDPGDVEYTLTNATETALLHPDTFQIPPEWAKVGLDVGECVKLGFNFREEEAPGERMWVKITEANYPKFAGTLENTPLFGWELEYGDTVHFTSDNIMDIELIHETTE